MITYSFLQNYWWFIISLLGGLLVFLLFVQGGNSLLFSLGKTEEERSLLVNSTGRKWEFTFTTLVTFGGAFFASFPLFYSTSFGGAYWLWMLILVSFVLQAVAYEFQSKAGNVFGRNVYRWFLVFNGFVGPFLLGAAVATFFTGSAFIVNKSQMGDLAMPVISSWTNTWHGIDALGNLWNVVLGFAVFFLARVLGCLYYMNNISDDILIPRCRRMLLRDFIVFLIFFLSFVGFLLLKDGYAVTSDARIVMVPYKYLLNLLEMPEVLCLFLLGVVGVLYGAIRSIWQASYARGIWFAGTGSVLTVLALFLLAGYNQTAFYPSLSDLQSSLTLSNSSSSEFTLLTMAYVSIAIPFVLAYIVYAWHAIDKESITRTEMKNGEHTY
ncbi:MAG: cytochrome d ubiquinol oxidase subunit II [Bacteroidaceae bacterium]